MKKRILCICLSLLLMTGQVSNGNTLSCEDGSINRMDGYTNDTEISSSKYSKNKYKYHEIFQMGLAGPGLTAWDYATGKGVNVAVFDGGFNASHYDLAGNVKGCYNAVTKKEGKNQISVENHGTSCAGILAAVGNNQRLSAGVAYNAGLYLVQVDANGSQKSYEDSIIEGIRYAVQKKCKVISISLSDTVYSEDVENAINNAYVRNDVLVVASGGNTGKEEYRYPSSYRYAFSVSALNYSSDTGYTIRPQSTYNGQVDVAAPGSGLHTVSGTSNTGAATGGATSAATPYAAGVAALVFSVNPTLKAREVANILRVTAKDAGTKGYDKRYGYGIIQPLAAVQMAKYGVSSKSRTISGTASYQKAYGSKAFSLNAKTTGSGVLTYKSSNPKVASVNSVGKVTIKGIGKATIKVTIPKSGIFQSASKNISITVVPKRTSIKSAKNVKGKKIKITWKKDSKVTGYKIQIAANKKFKGAKTSTVKKSTVSKTISKRKKGKTYYIRICSYKKTGGKTLYGSYSKVKKVKVKK